MSTEGISESRGPLSPVARQLELVAHAVAREEPV